MKRFVILLSLLAISCGDTIIQVPNAPSTIPVTKDPVIQAAVVEFRVIGNASNARVRFLTPLDGLSQITTTLPYYDSFASAQNNLFLSLEAAPVGYPISVSEPFLQIQIFVNGILFRESSSADFFLNPISVSGTWRK